MSRERTNKGTGFNDIKRVYIKAAKDGNDVVWPAVYFIYGDGYVEAETSQDKGMTSNEFYNYIVTELTKLGFTNDDMNKPYGFETHWENDELFAEYDAKIRKQKEQDEFNFSMTSKAEEAIKAINEAGNKSASEVVDTEIDDDIADLTKDNLTNSIPEEFAIANVVSAPNDNFENKEYRINKKQVAFRVGIAGLAAALGVGAFAHFSKNNNNEDEVIAADETVVTTEVEPTVEEVATVVSEKLSLEGQDWDFYVNNFNDSIQKDVMVSINNFLMNANNSEDWMNIKLTPEMIETLQESGVVVDGDEAIFGWEPEQVYALRLVYGHDSPEELVTLTNGEYIDIAKVFSSSESLSNQAIRNQILYLLNSDNTHSGIENVLGFTEEELQINEKYLQELQDFKNFLNAGQYDEAEAKMKEIKVDLNAYMHEPDTELSSVKAWVSRTTLVACSTYSVMLQYTDTIDVNLYDEKTNKYVDETAKTMLFDELMMRDDVLGWHACVDEEGITYQEEFVEAEFLNQLGFDSSRYHLVRSDVDMSIADQYVSGLENRLKTANEFSQLEEQKNLTSDAAYLGGGGDSNNTAYLENNSRFDELRKDSTDSKAILNLMNDNLIKENKAPKNMSFFSSIYSKFNEKMIAIKDSIYEKLHGVKATAGKALKQVIKKIPGRTIYIPGTRQVITWTETWTEEYVTTRTERKKVSQKDIDKEDAKNKKKAQEKASKTKVTDGETGKDKDTTYQDIYNKAINDKTDGKTKKKAKTNLDDDDKTKDGDKLADKVEDWADEDAEQINKEHEKAKEDQEKNGGDKETYTDEDGNTHYRSGGKETIEEEYKNADIIPENEAEEYNKRLQEQQAQSQSQTQEASQSSSNSGEYTTEDPTNTPTFAPVLEEDSSLNSASEEEYIDAIVESLAQEVPTAEVSETKSK